MKRILSFLFTCVLSVSGLHSQPTLSPPEIATTWPGIHFQILQVQRIAGNRLLVAVGLHATAQAPAGGTLIGNEVKIPANARPELVATGVFRPKAFSIVGATMTYEQTKQTYAAVKPDPAGPHYLAPVLLTNLFPNQTQIMTIEFPVPPPPDPGKNGGVPVKQTISILLPKAVGPISAIPVPSAGSTATSAPQ